MKTGIIIQARMSSTRLPGKVLLPLGGKPMLWHVVTRCRASKLADKIIVATSTDPSDNAIVKFCEENGFEVFRGNLENVQNRFYQCALKYRLTTIVRITSDCPLIDPFIIDQCIETFRNNKVDYVGDVLDRTFPRGLDCEVFSFEILEKAHKNSTTAEEREHITLYIVAHGSTLPYHVPKNYHGAYRFTVDEAADYQFMQHIYDTFYRADEIISVPDVIAYVKNHPDVANINQSVNQKHSIH